MRITLDGNSNNPLDPFNDKNKKKKDKDNEDSQKITLDPFAKSEQTQRKPRKSKQPKKKSSESKEIDKIKSKLDLEKDSKIEEAVQKTQESLAKKMKSIKERPPLNPKIKKIVVIGLISIVVLFILFIFGRSLSQKIRDIQNNTYLDNGTVMMPEITGYSQEDGLRILDENDIRYEIEYMYNQYFEDGTIIKCSVDAQNPVKKGSVIKVYICKDENFQQAPEGVDYFKNLRLPEVPQTKHQIKLTHIFVEDTTLTLKFENTSNVTITMIEYTLGFYDNTDFKFANQAYLINDISLAPGEAVVEKITLDNAKIDKITYEDARFKYEGQ